MKSFRDWRDESKHLPHFLREFHDQKDLFKSMLDYFNNAEEMPVNWQDGHVFTIDWFLWFMAAHGYTLQKTKAKCDDFHNLDDTMEKSRQARRDHFASVVSNEFSPPA